MFLTKQRATALGLVLGLAVTGASLFLGLDGAKPAVAGIAGSKHDMATHGFDTGGGYSEICVFCHTPHAGNASAPLWNKDLTSLGGTFTMYSSSTLDATENSLSGSASLACLSCHDGVSARNAMINAPGSGAGGGYWAGTFTAGQQSLYDGANTAGAKEAIQNTIANIGLDLTNDHPIGIQYCAGGINATTGSAAGCTDKDFNAVSVVDIGGTNYLYKNLPTDPGGGPTATAGRERTDIILYRRSNGNHYVECMSCHDPHNTNNTAGERVSFLRNSNTGSQICLACHNK